MTTRSVTKPEKVACAVNATAQARSLSWAFRENALTVTAAAECL